MELRRQNMTTFITPLREGGSLPALVEADDDFKYVLKFRGAGHGSKALIAELIGGEIARALGFKVPELVFLDLDEDFGRTEPDAEVQDLLKASRGLNLGMHFLSGALTLDPYANPVDEQLASEIVWLDSYLTNVDRTAKNTNMLVWHNEPWLIDHGASLYFHHSWSDVEKSAKTPFPYIKDHVFLRKASRIAEADARLRPLLTEERLRSIVNLVPDEWLKFDGVDLTPEQIREVYMKFLTTRLSNSQIFVKHAIESREAII